MPSPTRIEHAFEPRPTQCLGVRELDGWRMRLHAITLPGEALNWRKFEPCLELASAALPRPPEAPGRPGVGFIILHQGRGVDYVVLCWWSRENELPIKVFVRERAAAAQWRDARGEESICVWDMEVISREREAYIRTVLAKPGNADVEAYLGAFDGRSKASPAGP